MYELAADRSYAKGPLLNTTVTERYVRPKNCVPRDVNGDPIDFPSLPPSTGGYDCLEGPLMGIQFGTEWSELPGNWGFGEILTDTKTGLPLGSPEPIPPGDYLVEVVIPDDPVFGRPLYTPTREEDLNTFDGDEFYPFVAPSPCAGPLHIVDVADVGTDGYDIWWTADPNDESTPVVNPNFAAEGGSRFEGQEKRLCNVKLVNVGTQKGIAPLFQLWTEVPIPGRWRGYVIDDLNVTTDPLNLTFGEKLGMGNSPVGIYDYTGRLVHTMHTDYHGVFEVILPSDATYNAPSPSGMFASVYYIYGNDPGQPGNLNTNYNPQYRSIGTSFEIYPGVIVPADLAPTQNGVGIWGPGSQTSELAKCDLEDTTPQIFAVDKPYLAPGETLTITGKGFGLASGHSRIYLGSALLAYTSWTDREIIAEVPVTMPPGPWQLSVRAGNRRSTVNGLTIHVLGGGYTPPVLEVGPGKTYSTIQAALDAAAGLGESLVVVYPGATQKFTNPLGIWYENPIIYSPVMLQGVGPGGVYTDGTGVRGTIIDGRSVGGDTPYAEEWLTTIGDIWLNRGGWDGSPVDGDGNPRIYQGPVITVLAEDGEFSRFFPVTIDGFTIQGGDQQGVPNNLDQNGGGIIPGVPAEISVQGGGIFVNAYARYMRITNNVIQSNGGAYGGAIRLGTPHVPAPLTDHENDSVTISNNRILANGSTNLAGSIGLFNGAANYVVSHNDICGNFSAEYGGGISHYGYSPGGIIHHNRVYFNRSYDEGGGIMIAGELPADPDLLSEGAGAVGVFNNMIQANLGNDDGGGLRFLMSGAFTFDVYNNIIANNISTHEGGGISINDAPNVRIYNNTIVKNLTTATSTTSNG
ncbi:MAG: IPT/TIG domain-containing protein, partial [Anaerolineae bacterium]